VNGEGQQQLIRESKHCDDPIKFELHPDDVLTELGYDAESIAAMHAEGVA